MSVDGGSGRRVAGRYHLRQVLGRGGAGAVWRAHDERLDRPVAVKEIGFTTDDDDRRTRALREARAVARLRDHGAVQIYDVFEDDDGVYLIMELVDAPNLQVRVRRDGPMSPDAVARLGRTMLDTLEAAHRVGIVHRDVKPSNVLMDGDIPRLTDFGIARLRDEPGVTSTGVVVGTPAYIAPEHAQGRTVGVAADLYGLGATLYYAVEGVPPFGENGSLPTLMAVVQKPPRPTERAGPLDDLLRALLTKDPDERPDAAAIGPQLRQLATTSSVPAAAPQRTAVADPAKQDGRHPAAVEQDELDPTATAEAEGEPVLDVDEPDPTEPTSSRRVGGRRPALVIGVVAAIVAVVLGIASFGDGGDGAAADPQPSPDPAAAAVVGASPDPTPSDEQPTAMPSPDSATSEPAAPPAGPDAAGGSDDDAAGDGTSAGDGDDAADDDGRPDDADSASGDDGVLPPTDVAIPDGWETFAPGDAPYRVQHPPDWQIRNRRGTLTDVRDPSTGTYLRLDWVAERRDPIGAWEAFEPGFAERHTNYQRIRMVETTHNGNPAALWEYTYTDGGATFHAYNLGVNAGDFGYALNLQARESNWDDALDLWPYFLSSHRFEP